MARNSILYIKSKAFAVRIVGLKQWLCNNLREYSLADQILRSGTSIGANVAEALDSISRKEFRVKLGIALKECSETKYWLEILYETHMIQQEMFDSLFNDCIELQRILTATIKSLSKNSENE